MIPSLYKARFRRAVSMTITGCVLLVFMYVLYRQWQAGQFHELKYPVAPFLLSALGMFGLVVWLGLLWRWILKIISGRSASMRTSWRIHFVSWLARYSPVKIGQAMSKAVLGVEIGYGRSTLIASVFYENVFFIGSGVSVAMLCLGPASLKSLLPVVPSAQWMIILGLVFIAGLLLSVYLLPRLTWRFLKAKEIDCVTLPLKPILLLFSAYHLSHLIAGLGFYWLLNLLVPQNNVPLIEAVGILTAAHIGGVLAFIVPAGLGVRESILALLLGVYMPMEQAVLVSLIARAWSAVADVYVLTLLPLTGLTKNFRARPSIVPTAVEQHGDLFGNQSDKKDKN